MTAHGSNMEEIRKALENQSGYPFELEIVRRLEASGYYAQPNYSFEDQDTGVAREIDFHAFTLVTINSKKDEFLVTVLLGSCKDNKNPYVFFTRDATLAGVRMNSDVPIAGYPLTIYDKKGVAWPIKDYFDLKKLLHIGRTKVVSSQFCELVRNDKQKNQEYTVQSQAIFNNAYIPLIKVMSREIEDYNSWSIPDRNETSPDYEICYPILVIKGPMFEYYVPSEGPPQLNETKHILLTRHYVSSTVRCQYAIDVIHESYLEEYLELIHKDIVRFVNRIRRHKKVIAESIKKLADAEYERTKPQIV